MLKADKYPCNCPREGPSAIEEGRHEVRCPTRRAGWGWRKRIRQRIWPAGNIVAIGADFTNDDQVLLGPDKVFDLLIGDVDESDAGEVQIALRKYGRSKLPGYARWMDTLTLLQWFGAEPLTVRQGLWSWWHHVVLFFIRARRWLMWAAPFVGTAYVVIEVSRWLW